MSAKRRICLLGSTGSIGQNCLRIIRAHLNKFEIVSLSCGSSAQELAKQIQEFKPEFVSVGSDGSRDQLKKILISADYKPKEIFVGVDGHQGCVKESQADVVIAAMTGSFGLKASLQAIEQNCSVLGIANKEILVMAGSFILDALKKSKTTLIPVDSEHSAIFQCLMGNKKSELRKVILTASGGPFRELPFEQFQSITKEQALKHPNWSMGAKITIDSATMMNKGLEYIEAIRLFDLKAEEIEVVVHPQSIVHSMVEYKDRSVIAQLGLSDMRVPIALALSYPDRIDLDLDQELDFTQLGSLTFEKPDLARFPCLKMAMEAEALGPQASVILNASNEVVVEAFLKDRIKFVEIPEWIGASLSEYKDERPATLEEIIQLDSKVKLWTKEAIDQAQSKKRVGGI